MRKKLANGEIEVSGDQWPLLLYKDQMYDPDEPWDGLFRCKLLVSVSFIRFIHYVTIYFGVNRHINISSHPPVQSRKK